MVVKIEMDMPKSCRGCRGLFGFWCLLKRQEPTIIRNEHFTKKPSWCPLQEVKE